MLKFEEGKDKLIDVITIYDCRNESIDQLEIG